MEIRKIHTVTSEQYKIYIVSKSHPPPFDNHAMQWGSWLEMFFQFIDPRRMVVNFNSLQ